MNEQEIGRKLAGTPGSAPGSGASGEPTGGGVDERWQAGHAAALSAQLIHRDRRRVWLIAGGITGLWLMVAAGAIYVAYVQFLLVVPRATMLMLRGDGPAPSDPEFQQWYQTHFGIFVQLADYGMAAVTALIIVSVLASLATVWLVLTTRRATLRQINASLAEISLQLRQLQRA